MAMISTEKNRMESSRSVLKTNVPKISQNSRSHTRNTRVFLCTVPGGNVMFPKMHPSNGNEGIT